MRYKKKSPPFHMNVCAICGRKYRVYDGKLIKTTRNPGWKQCQEEMCLICYLSYGGQNLGAEKYDWLEGN